MKMCEHCGISEKDKRIIFFRKSLFLCNRHRIQFTRKNTFFKTKNDPHDILKDDGKVFEFRVYSRSDKNKFIDVKVSAKDKNKVLKKHWYIASGYIGTKLGGRTFLLHHYIIGRKKGLVVDHIDTDRANNTRENLRFATISENNVNRSKISGIAYDKHNKKWTSCIEKGGEKYWLGRFTSKDDAILARIKKQKQLYGRITKAHTEFLKGRNV